MGECFVWGMKMCCPVCCDIYIDIKDVILEHYYYYCRFLSYSGQNCFRKLVILKSRIKIWLFRLHTDTGKIDKKQIKKGEDTEGKQKLYFAYFYI